MQKILKQIGIKALLRKIKMKIYGNPNLDIGNKTISVSRSS